MSLTTLDSAKLIGYILLIVFIFLCVIMLALQIIKYKLQRRLQNPLNLYRLNNQNKTDKLTLEIIEKYMKA